MKPVVLSVRRKAHEMCLFTTNEPGETTRKLRHVIIYSSLSIRLSKSPIDCAFNLLQRMWLSLLNAGCKVELYDKKTIYIKQGMSYLCWNNNYAKLSSGIPTSHILFIYNIIVYSQERTLVESYNFSIKENLKKVFDILSRKSVQCRVRSSSCLKLCMLCRFPSKIVRRSYNGRTVVRDIVS